MKTNYKLSIWALRKEIQKIAFDANLWDRGVAVYPYAEICSKRRKELLKEIERLEKEQEQK